MKLKIECVKDVLEELESLPIGVHTLVNLPKSIQKHGADDVVYTVLKLFEANYISGTYTRTLDGRPHIGAVYDITFQGHEFLNSIRSPDVWERLKEASVDGAGACVKAVGEIALEIAKDAALRKIGLR